MPDDISSPNDARVVLSPRYVALLAGAALVVLVGGALLRPKAVAAPAVPDNELATLPQRARRGTLRDLSAFVSQRARDAAPSVVWLPSLGTSGLVWTPGSIVTAAPAGDSLPVLGFPTAPADSIHPISRDTLADSTLAHWRVAVARGADGRLLTRAGLAGGSIPARCGELATDELLFDAALPPAFLGGGLFDLDGNAVALAVPCDGRVAFVPLDAVDRALALRARRAWVADSTAADSAARAAADSSARRRPARRAARR